jgi:hypothetical protein
MLDHEKCASNSTLPQCQYFYEYYQNATNYTVGGNFIISDRYDQFYVYLSKSKLKIY